MLILIVTCIACLIAGGVPVKFGNFAPGWGYWAAAALVAALYLV
jgi:hypothetical protein